MDSAIAHSFLVACGPLATAMHQRHDDAGPRLRLGRSTTESGSRWLMPPLWQVFRTRCLFRTGLWTKVPFPR